MIEFWKYPKGGSAIKGIRPGEGRAFARWQTHAKRAGQRDTLLPDSYISSLRATASVERRIRVNGDGYGQSISAYVESECVFVREGKE